MEAKPPYTEQACLLYLKAGPMRSPSVVFDRDGEHYRLRQLAGRN
jgi:hypothetical protein